MRKSRLSKDKITEILSRLAGGIDAKQLATDYNVSVATIYNYRTRLGREGGEVLKAKRGRKPKNTQGSSTATMKDKSFNILPTTVTMEEYKFIINGVKVTVTGKAKNVHISSESMAVNF